MDGQRFDDLARLVATGLPRRRLLGMIVGGLGMVGARTGSVGAQTDCLGYAVPCVDSELSCCEGLTCDGQSGICLLVPSVCIEVGFACGLPGDDTACCDEVACVDGLCGDPLPPCAAVGDPCTDPIECCDGICADGTCVACRRPFEVCDDDNPCCPGLPCGENGECQSCFVAGTPCAADAECCHGTCEAGTCAPCSEEGVACSSHSECCSDTCFQGICANCRRHPQPCGDGCCSGTCGQAGHTTVCHDCLAAERPCTEDGQCCSSRCEDGACGQSQCAHAGHCNVDESCFEGWCVPRCQTDDECAAGAICCGACQQIECCLEDFDPNARCPEGATCVESVCAGVTEGCASNADCGRGSCCCGDGSCRPSCCPATETPEEAGPVTQLPDTGVGRVTRPVTGWLAAATGAAAFLAGKRLRPHAEPSDSAEQ